MGFKINMAQMTPWGRPETVDVFCVASLREAASCHKCFSAPMKLGDYLLIYIDSGVAFKCGEGDAEIRVSHCIPSGDGRRAEAVGRKTTARHSVLYILKHFEDSSDFF